MIFLTVGTETFPFDRLVRAVDDIAPSLSDEVFGQIGSAVHMPQSFEHERFVPFARMRELFESATRIVCHAGAGTTLLAIALGHVPVVLPRRHRFGEHVDDHQILFAERLAERELILCARDEHEIAELLAKAPARGAPRPEGSGADALCRRLLASVAPLAIDRTARRAA